MSKNYIQLFDEIYLIKNEAGKAEFYYQFAKDEERLDSICWLNTPAIIERYSVAESDDGCSTWYFQSYSIDEYKEDLKKRLKTIERVENE